MAIITTTRTSGLIRAPEDNVFDINGWIMFRELFDATVTLDFLFGGVTIFEQASTINLPNDGLGVYNGEAFYNATDVFYSSTFKKRLNRRDYKAAGRSSHFQLKITIESENDFEIHEIGIRFKSANT